MAKVSVKQGGTKIRRPVCAIPIAQGQDCKGTSMRNVASGMHRFREANRHLWSAYLMPGEGILDVAVEDSFRSIERELLRSLCFREACRLPLTAAPTLKAYLLG